jgi:hypothetical protein
MFRTRGIIFRKTVYVQLWYDMLHIYRYEQSVAQRDVCGNNQGFLFNNNVTFGRIILSSMCQRANRFNLKAEILTALCNVDTYCSNNE